MRSVVLCADDYGLTEGVSRGIRELASAGRLTATSAIVTMPGWPDYARQIRELRPNLAIGLHLNLTLGGPLGPMPRLAPAGRLPDIATLTRQAILRRLDGREIQAEIDRQLDRFEAALGHQPDHIDGHQHAHVLPVVRGALLEALARRYREPQRLLVRDPGDRPSRILRRRLGIGKALAVAALATGFSRAARGSGFAVNDGFAGFSSFARTTPFADELAQAFSARGPRHMVMCHPGHADAALAHLDPVVERRDEELSSLLRWDGIEQAVVRPERNGSNGSVSWWQEVVHG